MRTGLSIALLMVLAAGCAGTGGQRDLGRTQPPAPESGTSEVPPATVDATGTDARALGIARATGSGDPRALRNDPATPRAGGARGTGLTAQIASPADDPPDAPADPYEPAESAAVNPFLPRGSAPAMRMGRGVSPDGRVPDSEQTDVFSTYDPIHVSIHVPPSSSAGAASLIIHSQADEALVWQDSGVVTAGDEYLSFEIGPGTLPPGRYSASLTAGGRALAKHAFEVSDGG